MVALTSPFIVSPSLESSCRYQHYLPKTESNVRGSIIFLNPNATREDPGGRRGECENERVAAAVFCLGKYNQGSFGLAEVVLTGE